MLRSQIHGETTWKRYLLSTKVFKSTLESLLLRPRPADSAARWLLTASSSSLRSICLPRLSALRAKGLRVLRVEETERLLELRLWISPLLSRDESWLSSLSRRLLRLAVTSLLILGAVDVPATPSPTISPSSSCLLSPEPASSPGLFRSIRTPSLS